MANKVTLVLGIISAGTGVAAEVLITDDDAVTVLLGIISVVFTIITRIYMSCTFRGTGCCCCGKDDPISTPKIKRFYKASWAASVLAVLLLLPIVGLSIENKNRNNKHSRGDRGMFSSGATLALLSALLGITDHRLYSAAAHKATTKTKIGLPKGANVDLENHPVP